MNTPGYVRLAQTGELERRVERAHELLRACALCPRECAVDRTAGAVGYCGAGATPRVFRHMAHLGEEPPISGTRGSGVIFFSHCTMSCVYCQNYRWSRLHEGRDRSAAGVARMMKTLAAQGCHNLNLVSATQYVPAVLEALLLAARGGVSLPVVWNTSGYESEGTLGLLDGVVDVYLADLRYSSDAAAAKYSDAPGYVRANRAALLEMTRQVGTLALDGDGVAACGLIVRHLVLPSDIAGTRAALAFIADELGRGTSVSLMAQYYPAGRACEFPEIARRITKDEWDHAVAALAEAGLEAGWVQEYPREVPPIAGSEIEPDA
jgi:putative pyruvate formate lyase activating enzyme